MSPTLTTTVYLILKLSSSALSPTSPPDKPWLQHFDTHPTGFPPYFEEDINNHRYATTQASLRGRGFCTFKIEFAKNAHDSVDIVGSEEEKAGAEKILDECVRVGKDGEGTQKKSRLKLKFDKEDRAMECQFHATVPTKDGKDEVRWYWFDILPVQLLPKKTYGITDPERERERVEDMAQREEGLEMCKKTKSMVEGG